MFNRYFNVKRGTDFMDLNNLENSIIVKIDKANWSNKQDKEEVKNYLRRIFKNQWRVK